MKKRRPKLSDDYSPDDRSPADWARLTEGRDNSKQNYPKDWTNVSLDRRDESRWRCENCGNDFSTMHHLLHTHHCDGDKSNNSRENLRVVCVRCHSDYPGHNHMLDSLDPADYLFIMGVKRGV